MNELHWVYEFASSLAFGQKIIKRNVSTALLHYYNHYYNHHHHHQHHHHHHHHHHHVYPGNSSSSSCSNSSSSTCIITSAIFIFIIFCLRYLVSLENLKWLWRIADVCFGYDSSGSGREKMLQKDMRLHALVLYL